VASPLQELSADPPGTPHDGQHQRYGDGLRAKSLHHGASGEDRSAAINLNCLLAPV
jgi:hypothetical protein